MLPVLLLFFNRENTLKNVLEAIKLYQPARIYLASDGARINIEDEVQKVQIVRNYVLAEIDWDCEVKTFFRKENLGCKKAVHEAVQWFFSQEQKGIVLEDDIVPSLNFFHFCEESLERYKDNNRIGSITGRNELGTHGTKDCFVANRFNCWGWASWADRILDMDVEYGYSRQGDYSLLYKNAPWENRCYLDSVLGLMQTFQVNSWAYPYDLGFRKKNQLHIYPKYNMVKNIGFGSGGTHSDSRDCDKVFVYEKFFPKCLESCFEIDEEYHNKVLRSEYGGVPQLIIMRYVRYLGWLRRARKKVRKLFRQLYAVGSY